MLAGGSWSEKILSAPGNSLSEKTTLASRLPMYSLMRANYSFFASLNRRVEGRLKHLKDTAFVFILFVLDAADGLIIEFRSNCSKN
jgi:hypothetical protein